MMFPKPSATKRAIEKHNARAAKVSQEKHDKGVVRRRDRHCRFPLCGCRQARLPTEVAHLYHKGMGSRGGVSIPSLMILLCRHRHQHGRISLHAGTLMVRPLTPDQCDDAVAWLVDLTVAFPEVTGRTLLHQGRWFEVAREVRPGELEPLTGFQQLVLDQLAKMEQ